MAVPEVTIIKIRETTTVPEVTIIKIEETKTVLEATIVKRSTKDDGCFNNHRLF
ncbi:zonadhesin [Sesbania bispinosa]|nr:zonadhesin [Sesbania bispinosa]